MEIYSDNWKIYYRSCFYSPTRLFTKKKSLSFFLNRIKLKFHCWKLAFSGNLWSFLSCTIKIHVFCKRSELFRQNCMGKTRAWMEIICIQPILDPFTIRFVLLPTSIYLSSPPFNRKWHQRRVSFFMSNFYLFVELNEKREMLPCSIKFCSRIKMKCDFIIISFVDFNQRMFRLT